MNYQSNEIQQIIPHRYPFQLVDRIIDGEAGLWASGIKCVTVNEPFFCGHFPQYHVMPGVLVIEALAQVGAVAILSKEEWKGKMVLFGGIRYAKFRRQVIPGDRLELTCKLVRQKGNIGIGEAVAKVDGEIATKCELTFVIQ